MAEDEDVAKPVRSLAAQLLFMTDLIATEAQVVAACVRLVCHGCLDTLRQLACVVSCFICAHPGGRAQTWKDVTNESIGPFNGGGKPHGQVRTLLSCVRSYSRSPEASGEHPSFTRTLKRPRFIGTAGHSDVRVAACGGGYG
jgi:hypothetical protein